MERITLAPGAHINVLPAEKFNRCPTNCNYTVSGTNEGGVVVTIDRSVVANQPIYTDNAQSATEPATVPESVSASESQTTP